ncbi:MAG: V-type ATP synthase subunit E family protein [bacterium]
MSFTQLQQTLITEAREQAEATKERYRQEVEKEENRIKERAKEVEEDIIDQARAEGERQVKSLHQEAQLAARADILRVKQEELNKTTRNAVDTIMSWDENKVKSLIKTLLAQLPEGKGSVTAGEKHQEVVSREAEKKGLKIKDKTVSGDGGFVYSDAEVEVNALVNELVKNVFARHRAEIAKILFE